MSVTATAKVASHQLSSAREAEALAAHPPHTGLQRDVIQDGFDFRDNCGARVPPSSCKLYHRVAFALWNWDLASKFKRASNELLSF
jgi:hypothetical protein